MSLTGSPGAFWQYGLFVGGSQKTEYAGRFAVISGGKVTIITTSQFTGGSEGGGACTFPMVQKGLNLKDFLPKSLEQLELDARNGVPADDRMIGEKVLQPSDQDVLNECKDVICDKCGEAHTVPLEYYETEIGEGKFECSMFGCPCNTEKVQYDETELDPENVLDEFLVDHKKLLRGFCAKIRRRIPGLQSRMEDGIISRVDIENKILDVIWFDGEISTEISFREVQSVDESRGEVQERDWPKVKGQEHLPAPQEIREPEPAGRGKRSKGKKVIFADEQADLPRTQRRGKAKFTDLEESIKKMHAAEASVRRAMGKDLLGNHAANYADWSQVEEDSVFFSFETQSVIRFTEATRQKIVAAALAVQGVQGEAFKSVTANVPRTWKEALRSPIWGDAARKEWNILIESGSVVEISPELARTLIEEGAQELFLFPIYEEKVRDGILVKKVRLVADGAHQTATAGVFNATPSKEEFNVLMQIFASYDMDFAFLDELRAFLNAEKNDKEEILIRFRGDSQKYRVLKALYGLRGSPKDYSLKVKKRLLELEYRPLTTGSQCLYYKVAGEIQKNGEMIPNLILVFHHVDDFAVGAFSMVGLDEELTKLTSVIPSTEPIKNEGKYLGVGITRDRKNKAIMLDMHDKIMSAAKQFELRTDGKRVPKVPIPTSGFIVSEEELDLLDEEQRKRLEAAEVTAYMGLVGVLVWISTVRFDIKFAVMYLSWFTKSPRVHHVRMGYQVLTYLVNTSKLPLVLGGEPPLTILTQSDCSLATGPKRRSILGYFSKLNGRSGAVMAKCHTTKFTVTNVFQGELDSHVHAVKCLLELENILVQLGLFEPGTSVASMDNLPMKDFVSGDASARLTKHMEIRLWFVRDLYRAGKYSVEHIRSEDLTADIFTKVLTAEQFIKLRAELMGLGLIPELLEMFS